LSVRFRLPDYLIPHCVLALFVAIVHVFHRLVNVAVPPERNLVRSPARSVAAEGSLSLSPHLRLSAGRPTHVTFLVIRLIHLGKLR